VNRRDHYHRVIEAARDFAARRRACSSDVALDFSFVITGANLHELADFLRLAADHDVDRVRFFFDLDRKPPDQDAIRRHLDAAVAARQELPRLTVWGLEVFAGRMFGEPVADEHLESTDCSRTFNNLYVGVNGDASFCNFLHWRPIGNLCEQEVTEVWNSPAALEQRQAQARRAWDYCVSAYCGPTERAGAVVTVPLEAVRTRPERS
jgi:MoaA/NifB/PqqE/SkfB family radical SAM enzyme